MIDPNSERTGAPAIAFRRKNHYEQFAWALKSGVLNLHRKWIGPAMSGISLDMI